MNIFLKILSSAAAVALSFNCAASAQEAPKKWAVVEFSANFMREAPDYAAELGDQALMGTVVEVLDKSSYWVKIKSPEPYTAWVNEMGLVPMSEEELQDYLEAPKYICTAAFSHIYEEPSMDSRIVSDFVLGDIVRIMYSVRTHAGGRYKGYEEGQAVLKKKFVGVVLPSGKTGYVPAKDVAVFYKWAKDRKDRTTAGNDFRQDLLTTGYRFLGVPYMWGGTSIKNVDCSGFTSSVYFANGVLLPRNASQQARIGEDVGIFKDNGDVDWSGLLPGDLLFWGKAATDTTRERITHVGMYIGDGKFIHSAQVVRVNSLDSSAADFYNRKPVRARRIVGHIDANDSGTSPPYAARSTFRGISAVTARKRHPHRRSHRLQRLRNHLHLTQPVLLSAELVRSQPVSDTRIAGHIGSNDSGIISTLRSPLIQQVHHLLINSSLGSLN